MKNLVFILSSLFVLTSTFSIAHAATPPAPVPQTGQTICYGTTNIVITCAASGQDGEFLAGVPWPTPRFNDNGDQTITDKLTGLIWSKDAGLNNKVVTYDGAGIPTTTTTPTFGWQQALDYVKKLNVDNYLGHSDWRLPNINELASLNNKGQTSLATWLRWQGFTNVQFKFYWSGTTQTAITNFAWVVHMDDGHVEVESGMKSNLYYIWPVRSGQLGSFGSLSLPKTGQTACYDSVGYPISCSGSGQDGELQTGVAWPTPRFSDNSFVSSGDKTITDNLTGLIWSKDANLPVASKTWQQALDYIKTLNSITFAGHNDWRLPNSNELASLVNRSQAKPAAWLNTQGFVNVQSSAPSGGFYFSNSISVITTDYVWLVHMNNGVVSTYSSMFGYVWPVRSGQPGAVGSLINGSCGSSNNLSTPSVPTANLCSTGSASTITGSGPWYWSCAGSNGGTTTSCSAYSGAVITPPGGTTAKVYLGTNDNFTVSTSGETLYGGAGTDSVTIATGISGAMLDQNIEKISLPGAASTYTFKQTGNKINVYDTTGVTQIVSVPVQSSGTQLNFSNGAASALLTAGVMTLGGAKVSTATATALTPTLTASTPATTTDTTAKVYLGTNDIFTVSNNGMTLYGGAGNDTVTINAGMSGVILDQNVERINFAGASDSYAFKQTGNKINIYDASGVTLIASVPVQSSGTVLGFSNGSASALLSGGVMTLGGATVSSTVVGAVMPTLK